MLPDCTTVFVLLTGSGTPIYLGLIGFNMILEFFCSLGAKNSLAPCVYLMGASDSLEKELVDAALFAFTSDWEGLPNALMEAMALGLPIVATDCPPLTGSSISPMH